MYSMLLFIWSSISYKTNLPFILVEIYTIDTEIDCKGEQGTLRVEETKEISYNSVLSVC